MEKREIYDGGGGGGRSPGSRLAVEEHRCIEFVGAGRRTRVWRFPLEGKKRPRWGFGDSVDLSVD
jgi:hypothetical protein